MYGAQNSRQHELDEMENEDFEMEQFSPDWQLIDEISIKLLENGVGTFETLQRALPSVVLAQIERIMSDDEERAPNSAGCSGAHLLKLFRLAQLQIDYLLKTQQSLVERLDRAERRASRFRKENRVFRDQFFENDVGDRRRRVTSGGTEKTDRRAAGAQWGKELFRCNECSKVFLHANFLADHILRKHSAETGGGAVGGSLRRLVGGGGAASQIGGTKADAAGEMPSARGGGAQKLIRRGHSQQDSTKKRYSKKFGLSKQCTTAVDYHNFSSSIGEEIVDENRQEKLSSETSSNAWR